MSPQSGAGSIWLRGGDVVTPSGSTARLDVLADPATGRITAVGEDLALEAAAVEARTLDCAGCLILPGLVDLCAHIGDTDDDEAETLLESSRAAAGGGFTAVLALADLATPIDSIEQVVALRQQATGALCDIVVTGALTRGRAGGDLAALGELARVDVRWFGDVGDGVQDAQVLRRALEYAGSLGPLPVRVAQRPVLRDLAAGAVMHEGALSSRLGLPGQPAEAESIAVQRDLALAALTGTPLHLHQLSTAAAVEAVRTARSLGVDVTCDVSPHHLVFTDEACAEYDPLARLDPPLRTTADRAALRAGLADGTIDAVATGHRALGWAAKERPFDQAPAGAVGFEVALAVVIDDCGFDPGVAAAALSTRPAHVAGSLPDHGRPVEPGGPANLAVFDPSVHWTVEASAMVGAIDTTPFRNRAMRGRVRHTMLRGELVIDDGRPTR